MILFGAQYLLFVVLGAAFAWFLWQPRARQKEVVIAGACMSMIGFGLALVVGTLYFDPRPFVTDHVAPLFPHVPDNGFPSDHSLLGALVALTLFHYERRLGLLLLVMSFFVGLARIMANVHHPVDVAGSFGIAILAFAVVFRVLMPWIRKSPSSGKPPRSEPSPRRV